VWADLFSSAPTVNVSSKSSKDGGLPRRCAKAENMMQAVEQREMAPVVSSEGSSSTAL
jgi:hypothetical protein